MAAQGTPGIPDGEFERSEGVPITKEEVRAVQVCKARLAPGQTVLDIGCGSGSVTVEACRQVGSGGSVVAVDIDPAAVELTRKNLSRFGLEAQTVLGNAVEQMPKLPEADAVFVGGTGGDTAAIIAGSRGRLKKGGRIVIGTILIETLHSVLEEMEKPGFADIDITQVTIAKSRKTSTGTMMLARNPVTIVSATRA